MEIGPTQDEVLIAVRTALLAIVPSGVDVIMGSENRVPEPVEPRFVVMSPLRIKRLRTNISVDQDVKFTGSIAAGVMTVTAVAKGVIINGAAVFGVGVAANTSITAFGTGSGGVGTYSITPSQTISSRTLSAGGRSIEQGSEFTVQLDFHSDDNSAADLAQMVSTILRDPAGVELCAGTGVTPLYADDPRSMPFINENQQSEWRWVLEAAFQVNQTVRVQQQYADAFTVVPVSVDAAHPP